VQRLKKAEEELKEELAKNRSEAEEFYEQ